MASSPNNAINGSGLAVDGSVPDVPTVLGPAVLGGAGVGSTVLAGAVVAGLAFGSSGLTVDGTAGVVGAVVVLGGIVLFSVNQANKGVVTVQTAKVVNQESLVSLVTASGEIRPTTYTNISAQGYGRITEIFVKEGDHVKKGDKLLLKRIFRPTRTYRRNPRR